MNPELLLAHFDRISDAPDAIPRLRSFILDLAVRGKLVDQDSHDEPVSDLLKRIQAKRERLVEEGGIRKRPHLPKIELSEIPFPLPDTWAWVRLGNVIHLVSGQHLQPNEYSDREQLGPPYITGPADFGDNGLVITRYAVVRKAVAKKEQILLTVKGAGVGKTAICDLPEVAISRQLMAMTAIEWSQRFLLLTTHRLAEKLKGSARSLIPGISREDVDQFVFAFPPVAEQHRIVEKVDELMKLCDGLAVAQTQRESRRDRLAASALHHLNTSESAAAFHDNAHFYLNHLPRLTICPEQIQALRHAILNLAVRGQLVPQNSGDEPAPKLLKRIQAEKERLVKEGKINREKPPIPARPDDLGFELRPGWVAARISQVLVELQTGPFGSTLHESDYQKGGVPVINPASIKNGRLIPIDKMAVGPAVLERLRTFRLRAGEIVMARRGEMGRCAVVSDREDGWLCGTGSLILRLPDCLFPPFLVALIGSPFVREYLDGSAVGATMQNLNQSILLNLVVGLPPLAEQRRIVAKVDEMMALCDRLEAQLATTQSKRCRLLDAILHEALKESEALNDNSSIGGRDSNMNHALLLQELR